ncbi:DUF2461 domain-containing protein [Roseibium sp.]|uniref:DUF2461 domain-containing protein n=1 Tax=Roseibium sp. TaxID=1936156 RepID=UPI003BB02D14
MTQSDFAAFEPGSFKFLTDLAENNNKEWFDAHKADYQNLVKKPSDRFRPALADALGARTGRELKSKQFRINRDLRFSKDKTPYNTHIRMAFWPAGAAFEGKDAQPPSFFLSIETGHIRFGTGCMAFSKSGLGAYLKALETGRGEEISRLLTELTGQGFEISEPDLAKPPRGFPKDHAFGDLARHKGLAAWKTLADPGFLTGDTAVSGLCEAWEPTLPFWTWLLDMQERA